MYRSSLDVSGVFEVIAAFLRREAIEQVANRVPEVIDGSLGGFSEERLEFGEYLFDRVEVGRIGRQVNQTGANRFDGLADALDLVGREVVHDDNISSFQGRGEHLFDISLEGNPVHRAVDDQGRGDLVAAQGGDEGGCLPMAMRYGGDQAFAALGAAPPARHIGLGPGFIDEYQPAWIKCWLHLFPEGSRLGDVAALLLGGVRGFF